MVWDFLTLEMGSCLFDIYSISVLFICTCAILYLNGSTCPDENKCLKKSQETIIRYMSEENLNNGVYMCVCNGSFKYKEIFSISEFSVGFY